MYFLGCNIFCAFQVVLGTVISYAINLEENHGVVVVSDIPTG
jgi:hypothetical protein